MAKSRVIVKRRKTVHNIRRITRTMQLIATARFQVAHKRAVATKPYAEKLGALVSDLSRAAETVSHPLLQPQQDTGRSVLVAITSNRGLCGAYNTNVLRAAVKHLDDLVARGIETDVQMVGKKGINYFKFLRRPLAVEITHIGDAPRFEQVEPIANGLMDRFRTGLIGSAHIAYMKFLSVGQQRATVFQLLPLSDEPEAEAQKSKRLAAAQFEFSPRPIELLDALLPALVRMRLFRCFADAVVSEQIARMVAMKAATDAAGEMIKTLTQQYNRARQSQITMELLDIIGGADALT